MPALAQSSGQIIAYVGAYIPNGKGIHMLYVNPADGTLTPWKVLTGIVSPSTLAFHPNKKFLYAVNEISNYSGGTTVLSPPCLSIPPPAISDPERRQLGGGGPDAPECDPAGK